MEALQTALDCCTEAAATAVNAVALQQPVGDFAAPVQHIQGIPEQVSLQASQAFTSSSTQPPTPELQLPGMEAALQPVAEPAAVPLAPQEQAKR